MKINSIGQEAAFRAMTQTEIKKDTAFAQKLQKAAQDTVNSTKDEAADKRLRQVCQDMESVFINLMLSRMRASVPKSGFLGNNNQEEIMQSMLDSEMSKNMAKAGGMGLADMLYKQLSNSYPTTPKNQASR